MIVHPLESVGTRKRSLRGALPSVVVHAVIVLAAVHATAHAALPAAPPRVTGPIVYLPPKAPEQTRTSTSQHRHSSGAPSIDVVPAVDAHPLVPPTTIADHLPAIPVVAASPTIDRREFGDGIARGPLGGRGVTAADGVWTGLEVDRQVEPLAGAPALEYPDALRAAGVRGSVLAEFVVDTAGRLEPGSFRALRSDDALFTAATRAALLHTRFRPAESNGRRVRQLVQQSFSFVLH